MPDSPTCPQCAPADMIGMAFEPPRSGDMVTVHKAIVSGRRLAIAKLGTERVAQAMLHVGKTCEPTAFSAAAI